MMHSSSESEPVATTFFFHTAGAVRLLSQFKVQDIENIHLNKLLAFVTTIIYEYNIHTFEFVFTPVRYLVLSHYYLPMSILCQIPIDKKKKQ